MKKLITMFGIVALTATIGLAGCKNKRDTEKKDESPTKVTEPAKTDDHAAANLPAECNDYKAAVDKLASCDKLPAASRDALKQSYETLSKTWANVPADDAGKKAMADGCKAGADAVKTSAAKICGW